ncbi:alanine/glycine:cation symporter family protein [Chlamydiifrater phoenicopteri]|uniref:alanine/glycine:cation symporter family protein n=1 Tax=Chlamydiifrater phoenicopteri TaxID=2681469 RepID=UPI001BCC3979|nr:amino acid carrier protein [Chlamydiifrater phoenicopteri]
MYFLDALNEIISSYIIFPLILFLGGALTIGFRGVQFTRAFQGFRFMLNQEMEKTGGTGNVSRYEVIATILAGNFGTGNIVGMAMALSCGGPGAIVWIWVAGMLGSALQFFGSYIGIRYRYLNSQGEFLGGPIGCLVKGLQSKMFAALFCFFMIITAFSAGNIVQVSSVVSLCSKGSPLTALVVGLLIMLLVIPVLAGGNTRVMRFSAKIIPFVAGFYFFSCLLVIGIHAGRIVPALKEIFTSALGVKAVAGGFGGYSLSRVLATGVSRAVMATDCGSGMVSVLQSNSRSRNPVIDGLVTLVPPVIVLIVCSITTLTLIVSGAYASGETGAFMVVKAFSDSLGSLGVAIVTLAMALFGFTTLLTWFVCAEKGLSYFSSSQTLNFLLKILFIGLIPLGGLMDARFVWVLGDIGFTGMVFFNCLSVIGLLGNIMPLKQQLEDLSKAATAVMDEGS